MVIIHYTFFFLLSLGILVTIHELGHFLAAKYCNVFVEKFSIGFGKPILKRRFGRDNTEFVVAMIPLGGYVKMLGEYDKSQVAPELRSRTLLAKPLWQKAIIVLAGPAFNLLLAVVIYMFLFVIGVDSLHSYVGVVETGSVAEKAGIVSNDKITSVAGDATANWIDVQEAILLQKVADQATIPISLLDEKTGRERETFLSLESFNLDQLREHSILHLIGMQPRVPAIDPMISHVVPGSSADKAGLQKGDLIVSIRNKNIETWQEIVNTVRTHPEKKIDLLIRRGNTEHALQVTPTAKQDSQQKTYGYIGAAGSVRSSNFVKTQYSFPQAYIKGWEKTYDMSLLTIRFLWKIIVGEASLKNLSGPISIGEYAGKAADAGFASFLHLLGLLTVSLAIINLVPMLPLDGGWLVYHSLEALFGRPFVQRIEHGWQMMGIILVVMLSFLAIYNDIVRIFSL